MSEPLRCQHCKDVIGVYEPMIVVDHGRPRETSIAADGEARSTNGACYHRCCFARVQREAP